MSEPSYESVELPGVGELHGRKGTSTMELAGIGKYWHDKYQSARTDGLIAGASAVFMLDLLVAGLYFYLRN